MRVPTLLGKRAENVLYAVTPRADTPVQRTSQNERGKWSLRLTLVGNLRHFSVPRLNYAKRKKTSFACFRSIAFRFRRLPGLQCALAARRKLVGSTGEKVSRAEIR